MFGRQQDTSLFETPLTFNLKLAKLKDFVDSNLIFSAAQQNMFYDWRCSVRLFQVGNHAYQELAN